MATGLWGTEGLSVRAASASEVAAVWVVVLVVLHQGRHRSPSELLRPLRHRASRSVHLPLFLVQEVRRLAGLCSGLAEGLRCRRGSRLALAAVRGIQGLCLCLGQEGLASVLPLRHQRIQRVLYCYRRRMQLVQEAKQQRQHR